MKEPIRIVCSTNDSYAKHLAVMLTSLLLNKESPDPIHINILYGSNLSQENKERLTNSIKPYNVTLSFITFNNSSLKELDKLNLYKRYGKEAIYRIFIPNLFGDDVKKTLYLDCDMIVTQDITKLWRTNLDHYYLAAVLDPSAKRMQQKLALPLNNYFNSGVLLINHKKWRSKNITNKLMEFLKENSEKIVFPDQDALNAVLYDKVLILNDKWNRPAFRSHRNPSYAILHYITWKKPWSHNPRGKDQYLKYLSKTIWTLNSD